MKCDNCGTNILPGMYVCPNCGKNFNNLSTNNVGTNVNYSNNMNYNMSNINNNMNNTNNSNSKNKKMIIIALLCVVVVMLGIVAFLLLNEDKTLKDGSRTVMIYMVGSNLESESRIATYDLDSIDPDEIDLDKVNVLLYTGGTEKWHNFVKNDENGLYILTEDGFEQLESYDKKNMGDPDTLQEFLDYGYDNYKTQYHDLVFYNHGGAIDGAIYDDFTKDKLSLKDFDEALSNSAFSKHKLNTILFRTCLNGTLEVASVFAPYANYLIASEEITNGGRSSVLNYLNEVTVDDNEVDYGKKFIKAYEEQIDELDPIGFATMPMYSIVDLSKVSKINNLLEEFIESIDLDKNYNNIVKVRSKLYQYGYSSFSVSDYDTVDLYTLVSELGKYADEDNEKLLSAIEDAVVYNWSRQDTSNGLSIYFPYSARKEIQLMFLDVYRGMDSKRSYYKFIDKFNALSTSKKSSSFVSNDIINKNETSVSNKEFSLQLTEEQKNDYAKSIYLIFKKDEEGLYQPIYSSDNTVLEEDGTLKTNITNNLIKLRDKTDNTEWFFTLIERNRGTDRVLQTGAVLYSKDDPLDMDSSTIYFDVEDNVPKISSYVKIESESGVSGTILNPDDYSTAAFVSSHYNILDKNGNYTDNWDNDGVIRGVQIKIEDIDLQLTSLDEDGDYYCVFRILDVYGNEYYSKLLNIK